MSDFLAELDLQFLAEVRDAPSLDDLDAMLRWRGGEEWRRMAIRREIARRKGEPMPLPSACDKSELWWKCWE